MADKNTGTSINIKKHLNDYVEFISWSRWHLDLFLDLIKPEKNTINLDLDQRIMIRSITRFYSTYGVFPRAYGKCVSGDTILFTEDGMKEIESLFNLPKTNIEMPARTDISMVNRLGEKERSLIGIYDGYKMTNKIETREGYSLEATPDHPVLIMDKDGKIKWRKTKDLKIGDYLCINRKNDTWGNKIDLEFNMDLFESEHPKSPPLILPKTLTKQFAYYMGAIIGDGCLTRKDKVIFTTVDEELSFFMENFYKNTIGKEKGSRKSGIDYSFESLYFREYLRQLGLDFVKSDKKTIPTCIMNSTKENVISFIQGLFDTDGTADERCVSYTTTSEKMAKQVQVVLLNFGIISKRVHNIRGDFQHYTIFITGDNIDLFQEKIGFGLSRKKKVVEKWLYKKRNTNVNIIPYQQDCVLALLKKARELKLHNPKCFDDLYNVRVGENELSYDRLQKILTESDNMLGTDEYTSLEDLKKLNYFYTPITSLEKSANFVYDVNMPKTHSFVSNGIVSHNTFIEVLCMILVAIFYPNVHLALTAQTKENAASILQEKYLEIMKFFPLLANEIAGKPKFNKNTAEIEFTNGSKIDILANAQSTKGQRRARINVEESALLKSALFEDVIEPIPAMPRLLPNGDFDPCEMNSQINFFTTAGYRASDEFSRVLKTYRSMVDLQGKIFLGSSWTLPCWYRRGPSKDLMLQKREELNPIAFAQNYSSHWVGNSDGALIDIQKLMDCRTISFPEFSNTDDSEIILGVDVARSLKVGNAISAVAVIKIKRDKDMRIKQLHLINLYEISGNKNFEEQACAIKKIKNAFCAKAVCIDNNGLGAGLLDELMKQTIDPDTGERLGCWSAMNVDITSSEPDAERCVYALMAQRKESNNSDIIVNFMGMVMSGKLRLLVKKSNEDYSIDSYDNQSEEILPYILTDLLIDEVANLKLRELPSKKLSVEQVITRMGKDNYSALAYGLWYAKTYEDMEYVEDNLEDILGAIIF